MNEQQYQHQRKTAIHASNIADLSGDDDDEDEKAQFTSALGIPATHNPFSSSKEAENIDNLLVNYTKEIKTKQKANQSLCMFREKELSRMLTILTTMKKRNVVLTGEAGVGKTQIVEELARLILNEDPSVPTSLYGYEVLELPVFTLVSGTMYRGELEERIENIIDYVSDPENKAILFIDEIHQIMNATDQSMQTISQSLKPALARGKMLTIGATTTNEYRKLGDDPAFSRRFSRVHVTEFNDEQTASVLRHVLPAYEKHHDASIPDNLIETIVSKANEFRNDGSHRPDNALTLLDRSMSEAKIQHKQLLESMKNDPNYQLILQTRPRAIVSNKIIDESARNLTNTNNYAKLSVAEIEEALNDHIVGQVQAKEKLVETVRYDLLKIVKQKRPSSFLFVGPSGTGKTEMAKQIAKHVYGSEEHLIYINMTEYTTPESINRIIGSPRGYSGSDSMRKLPLDSLMDNPRQVILLDEFEKATQNVQNLFMQLLDEGFIIDNREMKIRANNAMIIATSNAGVEGMNKRSVGFSNGSSRKQIQNQKDLIHTLTSEIEPALLNRFEHVIPFESITKEQYGSILAVKYNQIVKEATNNRRDLKLTPEAIEPEKATSYAEIQALIDETYDEQLNGRPAERTMLTYIQKCIIDNSHTNQVQLLV